MFWEHSANNVESLGPSSLLASPELARECPCRWVSSPQMNCCREIRLIMLLGCRLLQQSPREPAGQFGWTRSLVVPSATCTLTPCLPFCIFLHSSLKSLLRRGPVPCPFRHIHEPAAQASTMPDIARESHLYMTSQPGHGPKTILKGIHYWASLRRPRRGPASLRCTLHFFSSRQESGEGFYKAEQKWAL